ncbi:MAG: Maf family nucleotide pyrophosphatase [Pseudomonadota bacterium]
MNAHEPPLFVLASSSPRRLSLLRQIGIEPDQVITPDIDETIRPRELPRDYVQRMATSKLQAVAADHASSFVLAADTVVACGRRILPKTETRGSAEKCLKLLSGRRHRVFGGVAIAAPNDRTSFKIAMTMVRFKRLSNDDLASYLNGDEWFGKAGGYAIQGRAEAFVTQLNGSYSNVVGLPLATISSMLQGLGWVVR